MFTNHSLQPVPACTERHLEPAVAYNKPRKQFRIRPVLDQNHDRPLNVPDFHLRNVSALPGPQHVKIQILIPLGGQMHRLDDDDNGARPISKLPEELKPYLTLLDDPFGLPICRGCQAAILPKSLIDHLRKHHQLPASLNAAVKSLVAILPALDFDDVPSRLDGSFAIEGLRVVEAYQCNHCAFIRRDVTDVRKHINKEHNLSASAGYRQIQAQSWFGGRRAVYWRVRVVPPITLEGSVCRWGFFGEGFGDKNPRSARDWKKIMDSPA